MFGFPTFSVLLGRIIGLVIGFTLHEFAHAWTAYRLGDNTPYFQRRLTLDPRAHLEPIGIILAIIVGFGWAKPVPVNPGAFYPHERRGLMIVALAGPVTNLIIATVLGIVLRLMVGPMEVTGFSGFVLNVLFTIVFFNLILFLFNLIPLSPLDGWKIMMGLLPNEQAIQIARYERESTLALMMLLILGGLSPSFNILSTIFSPFIDLFFNVILA